MFLMWSASLSIFFLPSALLETLDKDFFKKIFSFLIFFLPSALLEGTRQSRWNRYDGAFSLPSARQMTLAKEVFADNFFVKWSLPNVALGKAFAECMISHYIIFFLKIFGEIFTDTNLHGYPNVNP